MPTPRQTYAAAALQGLLAQHYGNEDHTSNPAHDFADYENETVEEVARLAWKIADEMIQQE